MNSLLDTSVVSQRIKSRPDEEIVRWLTPRSLDQTFLSVITLQEIRTGIELLDPGKKRANLERWLEDIRVGYAGRILPVTAEVAEMCGRLVAQARKARTTPDLGDALIAATAMVHGLQLATLNRKHFEHLEVTLVDFR